MIRNVSRRAWVAGGAALLVTLAAWMLTSPLSFGLGQRGKIEGASKGDGFGWVAPLPAGLKAPPKRSVFFPQEVWILENGVRLDGSLAPQKAIERGGWGRSRVQGSKVYFSTSDQREPGDRIYEVVTPNIRVPEGVLFLAWGGALVLWVVFLRLGQVKFPGDKSMAGLGFGLAAVSIGGLVPVSSYCADGFFLGLGWPLIWAAGMAMLATARRGRAVWVLGVLAVLPAVATWVYYVGNAASHGSFLVASVLPMSDAWLHFQQAAQMARQGVTEVAFNGRFLYPAYFSGFLWLSGWNLSLANVLAAAVGLLSLALVIWGWRSRLGLGGTALLALLGWLYFREFSSGQVMTEGLGFTCGMLGVFCLFLGVEQRRVSLLLLGVFWLSMGSSARPGALFALPLIGLSAGWLAWSWAHGHGWKGLVKPVLIVMAAAILVVVPFALNQAMVKALYPGKLEAFGNFSYTLNGLLTGSNWKKSYDEMNGDARAIMAENVRLMKAEPGRLVAGVARAYGETWDKSFLFRFGPERRLAEGMKWLFLLGLGAFWVVPGLRPHAAWIWAGALGVILSIPFAPPWDAEVRPYAATVGLQCLLPAAGVALILFGLGRLARWRWLEVSGPGLSARRISQAATVILLFLMVGLPLGRSVVARNWPTTVAADEPVLKAGSYLMVGDSPEKLTAFRKRAAAYTISQGEEAGRRFNELPAGTTLGIDWRDLQVVEVAAPNAQ